MLIYWIYIYNKNYICNVNLLDLNIPSRLLILTKKRTKILLKRLLILIFLLSKNFSVFLKGF